MKLTKFMKNLLSHLFVSVLSIFLFVTLVHSNIIPLPSNENDTVDVQDKTETIENTENVENVKSGNSMSLQEVAEKVIPSIVCIQTYDQNSIQVSNEGSGIILTKDGYIATNAHVVEGANGIKVITNDGTSYEATLIGSDTLTDLALLKIEAKDLTPAEIGDSDSLKVADQVMAVGNPGGLKFSSTVTVGYISALNRPLTNNGYTMNLIQTDTAINPGNSGGALVNNKGQVIGINSSKIVKTGYEGLGFSIPTNTAKPILDSLKEHGYVKDRAMIGITYQFVDEITARFNNLTPGVFVHSVISSNAKKVLQVGDIITKIDGEVINEVSVLTGKLASKKSNDTVKLTLVRNNKTLEVDLVLSENTQ